MIAVADVPVVEPPSVVEPVETRPRGARTRPAWPGMLSFAFAGVTVAGLITGIVFATSDLYLVATYVAWGAIGTSVIAVLTGLAALIGRFGSGWAVAGLVIGVVANPYLLTMGLDLIGGLWA